MPSAFRPRISFNSISGEGVDRKSQGDCHQRGRLLFDAGTLEQGFAKGIGLGGKVFGVEQTVQVETGRSRIENELSADRVGYGYRKVDVAVESRSHAGME